jgi:hypothetical protein
MFRIVSLFSMAAAMNVSAAQAMPLEVPSTISTTTLVHGCHAHYLHDMKGWHRHGKACEAQRGHARNKRDRKRAI